MDTAMDFGLNILKNSEGLKVEENEEFSLVTNFQDLVTNMKTLGTSLCPVITSLNCILNIQFISCTLKILHQLWNGMFIIIIMFNQS